MKRLVESPDKKCYDDIEVESKRTVDALLGNNDIFIASRSTINISLSIYYCGSEEFAEGAVWGPKVVDHFVLYYVYEGKGVLTVGNRTYALKKGDGFLVPKDVLTSFQADKRNPMKAAWVGFYGYLAEGYLKRCHLTDNHPIFSYTKDEFFLESFSEMIQVSKRKHNRYCKMMSILYNIMSRLIDITHDNDVGNKHIDSVELYLRKAIEYVDMNYSKKMSIQDMSDYVGLDRKYLHRIFKVNLDKSPQEYLIVYRITKACSLIRNTDLSISNIAMSVGYNDMFHFSKIFKKTIGVSPSEYRLNPIETKDEMDRQVRTNQEVDGDQGQVIQELRSAIEELKSVIQDKNNEKA